MSQAQQTQILFNTDKVENKKQYIHKQEGKVFLRVN